MRMKTAELTGAALDWAVELASGTHWSANGYFIYGGSCSASAQYTDKCASYSTDWAQGGPIIERAGICLDAPAPGDIEWTAMSGLFRSMTFGPTLLIAAMRCYVASKLGDEVEIPKELT